MLTRVEKCNTFGIKKLLTKSVQYLPKLFINIIVYLQLELGNRLNILVDSLTFSKIRVVQTYVYSKLRRRFSIYPLTVTWIQQKLDSVVSRYLRKWLHIPISGNVSHLQFPKSKLGVDFCSMADIYQQCQMSVRRVLRWSTNADIQHLYAVLDLKNAFGEVHHNLIYKVLEYHHIPDHIKNLIRSLYTDFQTSIITEQFNTAFIKVGRGVLQGDCLSPLLFNMSFNTFIQHIKSEKYSQLGFWKFSENGKPLNPFHWFQFADDAAVISGQENENQLLLNRFTL